jgi:hypothetical protein
VGNLGIYADSHFSKKYVICKKYGEENNITSHMGALGL